MSSKINHVAIIMDGNGRWAQEKRRPRVWGHIRGSKIVNDIIAAASDTGLHALTLYAFSTENWSRPEQEKATLFKLLFKFLKRERVQLAKNNIQFRIIGDTSKLDQKSQQLIAEVEKESKSNTGLKLSFAFSYGGRQEILDSVNSFVTENPGKQITEEDLQNNLYRPEAGDVDLLIRTAGDQRISNFLLWQVSYSELFFTDTKWPDFTPKEFLDILESVGHRDRRFGSLDNQGSLEKTKQLVEENK